MASEKEHHNGRNEARRVRRRGTQRLKEMAKVAASDGAGAGESSAAGPQLYGGGADIGPLLGASSGVSAGAGGLTATITLTVSCIYTLFIINFDIIFT